MKLDLTLAQKSLLNAIKIYGDDYPINIGGIIHFKFAFSLDKLSNVLNQLVYLSPNLRTNFPKSSVHYQVINSFINFNIDIFDDLSKEELNEYVFKSFDISNILFRFGFIKKTNSLVFITSHLISDGYTSKLMIDQLLNLLNEDNSFVVDDIKEILLKEQSKEYIENSKKSLEFFGNYSNNELTTAKPNFNTLYLDETIIYSIKLDNKISGLINSYLTNNNCSFQTLLMALIGIELSITNSSNQITIGTTLHNRNNSNKNVLGLISQTYPLNFTLEEKLSKTLLNIKRSSIGLYRNKNVSYEQLLKLKHNKLFSVLVNIQEKVLDNEFASFEVIYDNITDLDLSVNAHINYELNLYEIVYISKKSIFSTKDLKSINERLNKRLELILNNIDEVKELTLETKLNQKTLQKTASLLDLLNKSFKQSNKNIALIEENKSLTYEELEQKSNMIASKIIDTGLDKEFILINNESHIDKIISMVGIIKANNIFTFLPSNEKINEDLTKQLKIKLIIDDSYLNDFNLDVKTNYIRNIKELAVYHTSGTTNKYKSVILAEAGIVNYVLQNNNYQKDIKSYNTLLNLSNFNFDIALENILLSLINGKTLILSDLVKIQNSNLEIDFLSTTPTVFKYLMNKQYKWIYNLKTLVLGGEVLDETLVNNIKSNYNLKLYNSYGPTEASIAVTTKLIDTNIVTLGKPLKGVNIAIVNENNIILPNAYVGNIAISGLALSLGYLDESKFITKIQNKDFYLTNDLGYINENDEVVLVGRIDNQIKRSGIRIELDLIDNIFLKHNLIIQAKSIFENNEILSYVKTNKLTTNEIREYLIKELPLNYLPNKIIISNDFLIDNSGKSILNSKNIQLKTNNKKELIANKSEENIMFELIKETLLIELIYENDTFISLGGTSIDLISLIVKLSNQNIELSFDVFTKDILIKDYYKYIIKRELNNIQNESSNYYLQNKVNLGNNVLLLGATGYLGIHILHELITANYNITLLIRSKEEQTALERLNYYYKFYFNSNIPKTINVISGDLTKHNFGLTSNKYNDLLTKTELIINSAAKVDFVGNEEAFENINYLLVTKLQQISDEFNITLYHISTTALGLLEQQFNETSPYLNNVYSNNYLNTKRKAEDHIIKNFNNNDRTFIFRVGNLMPRHSDYKFQINKESNLIYQIINNDININNLSIIDLSAVDLIAKSILVLINNPPKLRVLHLYNPDLLYLNETTSYPINNEFTIEILKERNFVFPLLTKKYINNIYKKFKKK